MTYEDGIEIPSDFRNRCAPSRHSGESSLSPKEPSNSLTYTIYEVQSMIHEETLHIKIK